jgi:hypothetical protein
MASSYRTCMVGLDFILKIDNCLLDVNLDVKDENVALLCEDFMAMSIVSFCNTGLFLDQR